MGGVVLKLPLLSQDVAPQHHPFRRALGVAPLVERCNELLRAFNERPDRKVIGVHRRRIYRLHANDPRRSRAMSFDELLDRAARGTYPWGRMEEDQRRRGRAKLERLATFDASGAREASASRSPHPGACEPQS